MADEIHQIHDKLAQHILDRPESAASLLQHYLPEAVSQALDWPSLQRLNRSFVDEHWRPSEADFVYEVRRLADDEPVWIYVLLEHSVGSKEVVEIQTVTLLLPPMGTATGPAARAERAEADRAAGVLSGPKPLDVFHRVR